MQRIFMGRIDLLSLLLVNVLAKKEETVQMASTKEMACDKVRGLAEKKAIGICKKRGGVKDAPEGEGIYTEMGKNWAASVKKDVFCAD